jgi:glycosyltransferase involved in cell wall biosynthesis
MGERARILFIGEIHSTHARSWIDLLRDAEGEFEAEAFQLGHGSAAGLGCPLHHPAAGRLRRHALRALRRCLGSLSAFRQPRHLAELYPWPDTILAELIALPRVLRRFRPHIVHTFGFSPAALLYAAVPDPARQGARWVLQTRGGSDVAFTRADPVWQDLFRRTLPQADAVLCDNEHNYTIFSSLGIRVSRPDELAFAPGTGGIDADAYEPVAPVAERDRLVLWSKAYESPWSKGIPVVEAIRLAWPSIRPARFVFTAASGEIRDWCRVLPQDLRSAIELRGRIPRQEMDGLMRQARVVLAPSLVEGVPNTLYEAMAAGAVPIVSPLESITPLFTEGENVLYARNLYPEEIASSLVRALTDTASCESMAKTNRTRVRTLADRHSIRRRVLALYRRLAAGRAPR